ncbi:Nif3-like dinuclear metal center hexameric protein [Halobacterium sp. KA-4]|jgi:dinuclear metal center YbgI/SA1388 family protein|uniref:Nif3-like dinuclear metal center hexameric protein n=1 Tax=Halobacterium sp. KA-4 TaxID=2896367 RepID=UPI001E411845|nr:Nif3-like dinuclear metal center hexameric protein [Halobacterium sp. KA-4]MCD2199984.1 Nif3-like dinuclear metal center hexameric protein [Halobacterium sp. KA-4]
MDLSDIVAKYNQRLRVDDYEDAATNGLQVGPDDAEIEQVAFAVDAATATIEEAVGWGADLLVVHHGIVWGGIDAVTGREYDRVRALLDGDCALYAAHLPLDGHPELGNAARLADLLELENRAPFGAHAGEHLGSRGTAPMGFTADELAATLDDELDPKGGVQVLDFGPDALEEVAVVTGSGADWIREAEADGVDAFVTGEGKQKLYHEAREAGISVFLAGHYATETLGVRALQSVVDDWGVETTFVDHPTGL